MTKTKKETKAAVRNTTLTWNYDLTRIDPREYAAPLTVLFQSAQWVDLFARRIKLFRAASNGISDAFKKMEQIDRKAAMLLLQTMFQYCQARRNQIDGRKITLNEYFADFVRTEEQHEIYDDFMLTLDSVMVLSDVLENMLNDSKDKLRKLDPSLVLAEFDALKDAVKTLGSFTRLHHRDEHIELSTMFADNSEEIEEYLRIKTAVYVNKYLDKRQELIANGQLQERKAKRTPDRKYIFDMLADYLYNAGVTQGKKEESRKRATDAMAQFEDHEIEELMKFVIDVYRQGEAIHVAKSELATIIKTLPKNEVTEKIVKHIL